MGAPAALHYPPAPTSPFASPRTKRASSCNMHSIHAHAHIQSLDIHTLAISISAPTSASVSASASAPAFSASSGENVSEKASAPYCVPSLDR